MAGVISDNIFGKCSVAASTDIDRCGAVTLCNISPTTQDELASIYQDDSSRWRIIGALLEADFTGKACQADQFGMFDWIMANKRELGTKKISLNNVNSGLAEVMPFIKMLRKHPINNEHWTVTSGNGAGGTVDGQAYDWTGIVESQTGIPADVRWFPPRIRVFINAKSAGGTATRTAWKVVTATEIGSNQVRLYLLSENTASNLDPSKLTDPVIGYLERGTPNVNPHENYCAQIPGLNTNQLTPFWWESVRWSTCDDELYQKYVKAIRDNNPYFKMFGDVESVELNRQIMADFQRRHAWSYFFNKPLPNQTLNDYDQLEQILLQSDDSEGNYLYLPFEGRCVGRRANAIGIYEQHAECGMVRDLQGQVLNLPELFAGLYKIMRVRKSNGIAQGMSKGRPVIEVFTDSFYAVQFAQGMLRYFEAKSEGLLRLNMDICCCEKKEGPMGFFYNAFCLDYPNVELRVVTHPFFDDLVDAAKKADASLESTGRVLWVFDWTTNYQAILGSDSVTNRSGDAQRLAEVSNNFMCTMKVPRKSQKLNSLAYANIAECPQASLLLENFSSDVPEHVQAVGNEEDYYGDYVG